MSRLSIHHRQRRSQYPRGTSLIEIILYVALAVLLVGLVAALTIQLVRVNRYVQVTDDVVGSARTALAMITQEVRHAESVYTPTSSFDASPGQLSLETTRDLPTGEDTTYVDFYVDDGRLYVKREGEGAELITAEDIVVTSLTFSYLNQLSGKPAVRIALVVANDTSSMNPYTRRSISLVATAVVRSYD